MSQLTLDFDASLTARFRSLREVTAHVVYSSRRGLSSVAADLDMSPSELTKRLNEDSAEPRPLRVDDLEKIIASTGDTLPIAWLVAKYMQDSDAQRQQALQTLAQLAPILMAAAEQAGLTATAKKR